MARVVKRDGMVTIVFAHTDVKAWERLLRPLRLANLMVTTSWPMRSEREARSTAQISAVLVTWGAGNNRAVSTATASSFGGG